jgi:GH24 family phage-related lysozyme (muramidase)
MASAAERQVSECGVQLILRFYECELRAHPDLVTGQQPYRVGYGSKWNRDGEPVEMGERLKDQDEAELLLRTQLLEKYIPFLAEIPNWYDFTDNQRGALLSFAWCHREYFYGCKDYRTISTALRYKKYDDIPEVIRFYNKEKDRVTARMVAWRKAEAKLWETPSENSLENEVLVVNTTKTVKKGEPFTLAGICSPGWDGQRVNLTLDKRNYHHRSERPVVNAQGRWTTEMVLNEVGDYSVRAKVDGIGKTITIHCVA